MYAMTIRQRTEPRLLFYVTSSLNVRDFDRQMCRKARALLLAAAHSVERCNITNIANYLGIPRNRCTRLVNELGLSNEIKYIRGA
jgi:DNA-binding IscR family transcriptional regulator